jgi:hypothetical protein
LTESRASPGEWLRGAPGAEPRSLPHSAIAISEQELVSRLWARLSGSLRDPEEAHGEHGVWEIVSSRRELAAVEDKHFGSRTAMAARVRLAAHAGSNTCWTESLEEGWLFLFATAHETGCLIAVGDDAPSLLAQSRLIAAQIAVPVEFGQAMPAYPRILSQLCGPGWLACGSAAMAFDPICGEGTAHAVREAILASAVIHAAQRYDPVGLLEHYKARLMGGFLRHLQLSHHYYCTGGTGAFWRSELQLLKDGANWLGDQLRSIPGARFRLENFDLVPLEGQAVPQAR